jgi:hypothetical protein
VALYRDLQPRLLRYATVLVGGEPRTPVLPRLRAEALCHRVSFAHRA